MKIRFSVKAKKPVKASRNIDNRKRISRMSNVRSSRNLNRNRSVMAARVHKYIGEFKPWSGAVDTWNTLFDFDRLDALEQYIDEMYYDESAGEGVIGETELNDMLWFEPEVIYEAVGLYYNPETDEVSDEPFDEYDEEDE